MKHKIIKTIDYLLVVDDSEIKEGDWAYWNNDIQKSDGISFKSVDKKIIAHLPLNNSPVLEEVDLLPDLHLCPHCKNGNLELVKANEPYSTQHYQCSNCDSAYVELPLEDDVDKLALDYFKLAEPEIYANTFKLANLQSERKKEYNGDKVYIVNAFKTGYNKAKETYKYTEEGLRKAFEAGKDYNNKGDVFENAFIVQTYGNTCILVNNPKNAFTEEEILDAFENEEPWIEDDIVNIDINQKDIEYEITEVL